MKGHAVPRRGSVWAQELGSLSIEQVLRHRQQNYFRIGVLHMNWILFSHLFAIE